MTPLDKINNLFFKREDLNITGSAKDRWLSRKITSNRNYVISSSGNAAISAQHFCPSVIIFVSPKTNPDKLKLLHNYTVSPKPVSSAFKYAKKHNFTLLRQSTDPEALKGYNEIGDELMKQLPEITSIFIPVGSGTTLLGISQKLPKSVKIFAVQPAAYCPVSSVFDQNFTPEPNTITDSLGVKYLPLKNKIIETIKLHSGSGIVVQNDDVIKHQIYPQFGPETALCLAGLTKISSKINIGKFPVILVTGKAR